MLFSDTKTHFVFNTILQPFITMPPHTSLSPRSANTCIQKKIKTTRVKLNLYKYSIIEGLHKGSYSVKDIMEIEEIHHSTVRDILKLFTIRSNKHSLYCFECSHTFTKGEKHLIIRFCHENVKTTYTEVKQ